MTDIATQLLRDEQRRTAQLQDALENRVVLEQAKGMLAQAWHTSPEETFQPMREYARKNHLTLRSVAERIVGRRLSLTPRLLQP